MKGNVREVASRASAKKAMRPPQARGGRALTAAQLRELERKLLGLRGELCASIEGKALHFVGSASVHSAESAIKGDDAEVAEKQRASSAALQELDMLKSRLALVVRALAKLAANVYGLCEETEEPIGFERLSAVPWARYAVHVQELRERRLRDFKSGRARLDA